MRARVALLAVSTLVTFALLEAVFRTFFPQPLYAVRYAPWGFWHIPSTCLVHGEEPTRQHRIFSGTEFVTHVCYNSLGMREGEVPFVAAPGTRRIVVLGDSYGEGMEVELDQTVGKVLERSLNDPPPSGTPPPTAVLSRAPAPESDAWRATRPIMAALHEAVRTDGAQLLVANVAYRNGDFALRRDFFDRERIAWVDLALADPASETATYHYVYDTHWNPAGHARAARLIEQRLLSGDLLRRAPGERVEVLNVAMSAFSTCKELQVYDAIARRFHPDIVLLIYTANDQRNLSDADMCHSDDQDHLTVTPRTFSAVEVLVRDARGWVKSHSHFASWVIDRTLALPWLSPLRRDAIPLSDPDVGAQ